MFKLGQRLRDKVTGFEGIAIVEAHYLNGCIQFCLKPFGKDEKGNPLEAWYFDNQQLELVDDGILVEKTYTGGDMHDSPPAGYEKE